MRPARFDEHEVGTLSRLDGAEVHLPSESSRAVDGRVREDLVRGRARMTRTGDPVEHERLAHLGAHVGGRVQRGVVETESDGDTRIAKRAERTRRAAEQHRRGSAVGRAHAAVREEFPVARVGEDGVCRDGAGSDQTEAVEPCDRALTADVDGTRLGCAVEPEEHQHTHPAPLACSGAFSLSR